MSETCCPFCGAEAILSVPDCQEFSCGTFIALSVYKREQECYEREIAALKERLEAWRATKVGWDEYWEELNEPEQQRLRDLGEI